ncbi:glutaminyl-peptide cyclotransferase [Tautonia plasticadhaerens]|uniref:Glutamine cyclotransferase n=1 Tax=Tautonia plasticadhaerens TaxID=2527974 RepID=A0A518H8Y6_9BACT|nr:glutaminyl-peptide cyclotransferase [Tautonia plasticadhaerens]QDV37310.1 Glutamine cyclotransferase [Tautonia plasticadhaerens]
MTTKARTPSTTGRHSHGRRRRIGFVLASAAVTAALCGGVLAALNSSQSSRPAVFDVEIIKAYPHDPKAFTQGLEFFGDNLYEGTGQYGRSRLRKVRLETGAVVQEVALPDDVFGEGITVWEDRIIQLSWQERLGFVFDRDTLEPKGRFRYAGEGWGLTHDATHLIMSDGSSTLRFLDPQTYRVVRSVRVITPEGQPVEQLNELEYIDGEIFANIWNTSTIARISAATGRVVGWIDLRNVRPRQAVGSNAVLNGIAYEPKSKRLFVTGKNWSDLFEIRLVPRD